jgi:hypothetical protein
MTCHRNQSPSDDDFLISLLIEFILLHFDKACWLQVVGRPTTCNQPTATSAPISHQ